MKKLNVVWALVVVFGLGLAGLAWAQGAGRGGYDCRGCGGPGFGGPESGIGPMANLNLSKEQADKLWQAKEKFRNDTQPLRYELFKRRFELRSLFGDPKAEEATLMAKQKELDALQQNLFEKRTQFLLDQRKLLTPEQIKKLGEAPGGPGFGHRPFRGRDFGPRPCD